MKKMTVTTITTGPIRVYDNTIIFPQSGHQLHITTDQAARLPKKFGFATLDQLNKYNFNHTLNFTLTQIGKKNNKHYQLTLNNATNKMNLTNVQLTTHQL